MRIGNDMIDVETALAAPPTEFVNEYSERDIILYALSVGAGSHPERPEQLRFLYEGAVGFSPLPTFIAQPAVRAVMERALVGAVAPGLHFGLDAIVHGEQATYLLEKLPTSGRLVHSLRVKEIFDKGANALVVLRVDTSDGITGKPLAINDLSIVVLGAGGWGGERGIPSKISIPDRPPDILTHEPIQPSQALLHRLCGDMNPLHADPAFAAIFGFPQPILHGLCTFGFAGRVVVETCLEGDPTRLRSFRARFVEPVIPGDLLCIEAWREGESRVLLRATVPARNKLVLSNAVAELKV